MNLQVSYVNPLRLNTTFLQRLFDFMQSRRRIAVCLRTAIENDDFGLIANIHFYRFGLMFRFTPSTSSLSTIVQLLPG